MHQSGRILVDPEEVVIEGIEVENPETAEVTLTNVSKDPLSFSIKPGPTIDRSYEIKPAHLSLSPKESIVIQITASLLRKHKAGWTIRDVIHIYSEYFEEKFYVSLKPQWDKPLKTSEQKQLEEMSRSKFRIKQQLDDKELELEQAYQKIERLEEELQEINIAMNQAQATIEEKSRVEQELAKLQETNTELNASLEEYRKNDVYLEQVKNALRDKAPSLENLVDLTLQQERERNERKNAKVLEILQIKDSLIEDLEGRVVQQQGIITQLQHKVTDTKVLLTNAEESLKSANSTIEELKQVNYDKEKQVSDLKRKVDSLEMSGSYDMEATIENMQQEIQSYKQEAESNIKRIQELADKLKKADEDVNKLKKRENYVLELSNRHESIRQEHDKVLKEKDQVITELRTKVSTQSEHIESLLGKFSQASYHEVLSKVLQLEEENKNLFKQLAESQQSSNTFKQSELDSDSDEKVQRIQNLEAENLKLSESLKESKVHWQELEESLAKKNKELIEMQNRIIEVQKAHAEAEAMVKAAPSPEEEIQQLRNSLHEEKHKVSELDREKSELGKLVESLENANKELHSEMAGILQKIDSSENFTQNIQAQTQLVTRLNARISNLKSREEEALTAAAKAEEITKRLKTQLEEERKNWEVEKESLSRAASQSLKQSSSSQTEEQPKEGLELDWEQFEMRRYEKRIAELNKESTLYQNKHYEALKETHQLKEKYSLKCSEHLDEISKMQREALFLEKRNENLEEELSNSRKKVDSLSFQVTTLQHKNSELMNNLEQNNSIQANEKAELQKQLQRLKTELNEKEASIQERTSQIAILMETIEGTPDLDQRLVDLSAKVCHSKTIQQNLNRQISQLNNEISALMKDKESKCNENEKLKGKFEQDKQEKANLTQQIEELKKSTKGLEAEVSVKNHDISTLKAQLSRLKEEEKASKEKIHSYMEQLHQSQKRHSQVLAKERQDFRDSLIKVREEQENLLQESESDRPLVLAVNKLAIGLSNISHKVQDPEYFKKVIGQMQSIISECDQTLLKYESRNKELEFLIRSEVYFRYLDEGTIEVCERLFDEVQMLSGELQTKHQFLSMPNPEIYHSKLKQIQQDLQDRSTQLQQSEKQNQKLLCDIERYKNKAEALESKVAMLNSNSRSLQRLSQSKAEEEVSSQMKIRDEEIKAYVDSTIVKIGVETADPNKFLELSREICTLKIQVDDLQAQLNRAIQDKNSLEMTNENLSQIVNDLEKKELEVNIQVVETSQMKEELDEKQAQIFKLKESNQVRKEENNFLQLKIAELKRELNSLKKLKNEQPTPETQREVELRKQITELKEKHRVEIQNLKTQSQLELKQHKEKLQDEYNQMNEKFQDGEFPGDFKNQNYNLKLHIEELNKELQYLRDSNVDYSTKYENLSQQHYKVKEELEAQKQVVMELKSGLGLEPPQPKKQTKSKLTLEKPQRPQAIGPQRLVRALIAAKLGESEASRKLRASAKNQGELREQLIKKDETARLFEAKLVNLRRYMESQNLPEPPEEFYLDESKEPEYFLKKRVKELEAQVAELRLSEANSWGQYVPLSSLWQQEEEIASEEDLPVLVEGIIYLTQQLTDLEKGSSVMQGDYPNIENAQRIVIRALTQSLYKATKGEPMQNLITYKPSREEDRQLWYVELLETQLSLSHNTIKNLVDFTNQISVEVSGNMASSAQYKGAAIELANRTKQTADEIEVLRQTCGLIKSDLQDMRGCDTSEQNYRERALLAETMKNKTEEEMLKLKMDYGYQVQELQEELESANRHLNREIQEKEHYIKQKQKLEEQLEENYYKYSEVQKECDSLDQRCQELQAELNYFYNSKKESGQKMKDWKNQHEQTLVSKDKHVSELQKQVSLMQEEKTKQVSEVSNLRRQNKELKNELEKLRKKGSYDEENQDLKRRVTALKDDLDYETQKHNKEKAHLQSQLKELQKELQKEPPKKTHKHKHHTRKYERSPQRMIPEQTQDFNLAKQNLETQIQEKQKKIYELQEQLRQKIVSLDEEVRKRLKAEEELIKLQKEQGTKYQELKKTETELKEQIQKQEHLTYTAEQQNESLKQEKDNLLNRLQEKVDNAENYAEYVKQAEKDKKELETYYLTQISQLKEKLTQELAKAKSLKNREKELKKELENKENEKEELYRQIKDLENAWEQAEPKLDGLEKAKKQNKVAIKELEARVKELQDEKTELETKHCEKLDEMKKEVHNSYQQFQKTTDKYETQLSSLKEQYLQELRTRKGPKKSAENFDYMLQISKKDALIRSLKNELRTKKPKTKSKPSAETEAPEDVVILQSQVYKLKAIIKNLEFQLNTVKEEAEKFRAELYTNMNIQEEIKEKGTSNRKEIQELEKRHRYEIQKLSEEVNRVKAKWHSPDEWNNLLNSNKELEISLKRANEELNRKRELLENYKALKDQQETEANALQDEIEQAKDISEKMKKLKSEMTRKDKTIFEMKNSIEQYKDIEKKLTEDNTFMAERIRTMKNDLVRKDTIIKETKNKLDNLSFEFENQKSKTEQNEKLKEQVKKLKTDLERKDSQIKAVKAKLETTEMELESLQVENQTNSAETYTSLEKEIKKNERLQLQLKKSESQLQALYQITRRIFRELASQVESLKSQLGSSGQMDKEYYTDCMDILNLDMEELNEFVSAKENPEGTLEYIERILENKDVDPTDVLDVFNRLLEERCELEKSTADVAQKYENYIKQLKQEVSQQRRKYEKRISELERSLKLK